ncbi:hypothetical protein B0H13DRAFT_1876754 [Mycena leptocephala]|nr:hypothetical protein B0H13DRAFT_1876754 [Mycena leptocephala]
MFKSRPSRRRYLDGTTTLAKKSATLPTYLAAPTGSGIRAIRPVRRRCIDIPRSGPKQTEEERDHLRPVFRETAGKMDMEFTAALVAGQRLRQGAKRLGMRSTFSLAGNSANTVFLSFKELNFRREYEISLTRELQHDSNIFHYGLRIHSKVASLIVGRPAWLKKLTLLKLVGIAGPSESGKKSWRRCSLRWGFYGIVSRRGGESKFCAARKCAICPQTIVEPAIQSEPKKVYRLESREVQPDCVVCGYSQVSGTTKKRNGWAYCTYDDTGAEIDSNFNCPPTNTSENCAEATS